MQSNGHVLVIGLTIHKDLLYHLKLTNTMNKLHYTLAFVLFTCLVGNAQGIEFRKGTWADIQAKAKAENKHIFVDAYTTWCGPCKWQSKRVFPQEKVGTFFNKNFISFKMDMEKGEGINFRKKYSVRAFPTLVYFSPQGEMVHKTVGANPAALLLVQAKNALDVNKQLFSLKKKFDQGERSNDFLKSYVKAAKDAYEDFATPANVYLNQQGKDKWATAQNWDFIKQYIQSSSAPAFKYVLENKAKFIKIGNKKQVNAYIEYIFIDDMRSIARSQDTEKLEDFKQKLVNVFGKDANKYIAQVEYMFYARDKEKATQYITTYFDKYCTNFVELNEIAWNYYKSKNDTKSLEKALKWAEKSVKIETAGFNTDTQAHLLYKLKRYDEALKVAQKSIELAKKQKQDFKETHELLTKIKTKL